MEKVRSFGAIPAIYGQLISSQRSRAFTSQAHTFLNALTLENQVVNFFKYPKNAKTNISRKRLAETKSHGGTLSDFPANLYSLTSNHYPQAFTSL
jgi:hypothetical protein